MKHARVKGLLQTVAIAAVCVVQGSFSIRAQQDLPTFRASVALVPITAVVRDSRNRIVRDLARHDFQVLENSRPRPIVDFRASADASVSVAFVFDTSGSMSVASNLEKGKGFVDHFLTQVHPGSDQVALFTFDKVLRQQVPFTSDRDRIRTALGHVSPWGLTSLYDAIAETAKRLVDQPSPRRAIVVITDGDDTSSTLTPAQVSGLASAIDVPVYVVAVVSPLDQPGHATAVVPTATDGSLTSLAYWTGGDLLYVNASEQFGVVTSELLAAMRQQYVLAIESSAVTGWHRLEVKTQRAGLTVRARSGYFATGTPRGA